MNALNYLLLAALALAAPRALAETADQYRAALEADWVMSATLAAGGASAITPQTDAAGGCDGVKDGKWGFHTARETNPWWMVDLGAPRRVNRIVVWNRCDANGERSARLSIAISDDGKTWRTVHEHKGAVFGGVPDGKPLRAEFTNLSARYVSVRIPGTDFLHLDEVEVFGPEPGVNLALGRPANQSSISQWSISHAVRREPDWDYATRWAQGKVAELTGRKPTLRNGSQSDYIAARRELRDALHSEAALEFADLLFVKRVPGTFSHMSDQYYGWWSRPGGGVYVLKNWKSESQRELVHLTPGFAPGSFLKPELSPDGKRVLFSYCRYFPEVRDAQDKTRKENLPAEAFYHVFEMSLDGGEIRQLTRGRYDDFNARYLPSGEIVFLSTRRGTFIQTGECAARTVENDALPDSYVRCGGGNWRPVAVYTLHVMDRNGANLRCISPFENFEWDPVVANDGRIVYARWDYVDRDNMPYMSLWSTNPDGTKPQLVYKNHTRSPYGVFEARPIPNSRKFVFTASAHHSISGGSLCILDPDRGNESEAPLTRITPEVAFPEIEGWSQTWYATPFPLSERLFLASWSPRPLAKEGQTANEPNSLGLYVYHASGVRELIYRDPDISCSDPIPIRPRAVAPAIASGAKWSSEEKGRFLLLDIYQGLDGVPRGAVKALRVVGVPAKVQPQMNSPQIGLTADDPGKFVLGTVPVASDGSAHFEAPSGINVFFQALDERGAAIQTMRTVTYAQAGESISCIGCHEHRATAPLNGSAVATRGAPAKLRPGPEGTWPFRFDELVGPVLEAKCVRCHNPAAEDRVAARYNLTASASYESLVSYGKPSLRDHVRKRYYEGRSVATQGAAQTSSLLAYLDADRIHQPLLSARDRERLVTWLDLYGHRLGSFSDEQERQLAALKAKYSSLLDGRAGGAK